VFNYRGYAPSTGRPSAQALLSDSLMIFDRLQQAPTSQDMIAVGFSIGSAIAAYLARHRPVTGLILVTPADSDEVARVERHEAARDSGMMPPTVTE
jgi:hypothetical protein